MRRIVTLGTICAFALLAWSAQPGATPQRPASTAKKSPTAKTPARPAAKKSATTSRGTAAARARAKRPQVTWRNRQTAPTPERYRDIQNALAAKGYLSREEANGAWSQSSIDALKRFQADQNLESTGKINSLSLIALGLGPRRDPVPPAAAQ